MSWNTWIVLEGWSINREMMCTDVYCTHYIYRLYSLHDVIYIYIWYRYKTWSALFIWGIDASTERLWTCKQWERWHSSTPKGPRPRQLHVMLRDGHQSMNGEYTVYKYIYIGILMRDGWPYNIYHVLTMSQMNALLLMFKDVPRSFVLHQCACDKMWHHFVGWLQFLYQT